MTLTAKRAWVALVLALLALTFPHTVTAQVTVAIGALTGRGHAEAAQRIEAAIARRGFVVVDGGTVPDTDTDAAVAATRVGAVAVVGGEATERGSRWRFDLWVRDARGAELARVRRGGRGRRSLAAAAAELVVALGPLAPASAAPDGAASVDATQSASRAGARATASGTASASGGAARVTPADRDTRDPEATSRPSRRRAARKLIRLDATLGSGVRTRSVELIAPDGRDAGYAAPGYYEFALRVEARLLDLLFLRGALASSVGLSSTREDSSLPPVSTWFVNASADLGVRLKLGGGVELGAALGLGWDRYALEFNERVPTAEYVYVRPGVLFAARLAGRALVVEAELGLRLPWTVGDLDSLYGLDNSVHGVDGLLRLRGVISPGLLWSVEGGYRAYWLEFRESNGVMRGRDSGWSATGYVGWSFF